MVFPQGFPNAVTQMRREGVHVCMRNTSIFASWFVRILNVYNKIEVSGAEVQFAAEHVLLPPKLPPERRRAETLTTI